MRKFSLFLLMLLIGVFLVGCNSSSHTTSQNSSNSNDGSVDYSVNDSNEVSQNESINYSDLIQFPTTGGTYEYYSYGYHYSTTTVNDFSYEISEQSSTEIRIDFEFDCTLDYVGENAGGASVNFYANVYNKTGDIIDEHIINDANVSEGENLTFTRTIIIDKTDVNNGVVISFEGNKS